MAKSVFRTPWMFRLCDAWWVPGFDCPDRWLCARAVRRLWDVPRAAKHIRLVARQRASATSIPIWASTNDWFRKCRLLPCTKWTILCCALWNWADDNDLCGRTLHVSIEYTEEADDE